MNFTGLHKHVVNDLFPHLDTALKYHCPEHSLDVLEVCEYMGDQAGLPVDEMILLKSAALLHDIGFIDSFDEHETRSVKIAKELLPQFDYSTEQIEVVSSLIYSTKVPQEPQSFLGEILCDADLDYLGRNDFPQISDKLFQELTYRGIVKDRVQWDHLQVSFLKQHNYFTDYSKNLREPVKEAHLKDIVKRLGNY